MGSEIQNKIKKENVIAASIFISAVILAGTWIYTSNLTATGQEISGATINAEEKNDSELKEKVLPTAGVVIPVVWGDLGAKLVSSGAIDADKFQALYDQREAFTTEYQELLLNQDNGKLKMTGDNAGYLLNLFWALGLASKNPILDSGEISDPKYGEAGNFAATGGWTMAKGDPMDHFNQHTFFNLTPQQQALVAKVAKGIYRPCCGNSTHFPDCNHGMAMLGLLELMASQGVGEQEMWKTALKVNSYWFPDTYLTLATYMKDKGVDWKNVDPQEMLGINYSSGRGFANIASQVIQPQQQRGSSGCGVEAGTPASVPPPKQQSGCGV